MKKRLHFRHALTAWTALLLAGLLLLLPLPVRAEEDDLPQPGPTPLPQESLEAPPEEPLLPEETPLPESEEQTFEAVSLLTVGGHQTYLSGFKGGTFQPDDYMTRAQVAAMLYNLLTTKPQNSSARFSDVPSGAWYATAVNSLAEVGVFSGYQDGTFAPNEIITRAAFVTAVCNCFVMDGGAASFSDVPATHWAYPYISAAASRGWIHGMGNGEFQPGRGIRRSEAVAVMNNALERTGSGFAADRATQKFKDVFPSHWAYLHITEAASPVGAEPSPSPQPSQDPQPTESPAPAAYTLGRTLRVTADSGLNLRSEPNTECSVVTVLPTGGLLTVTDVSELPWLGVKDQSGRTGFVHSDYVEPYVPGAASGASLSASSLTLAQYQSARLDASVTSGLSSMGWTSSNPSVAVVGYTVGMGSSRTQAAMVYAKAPGTATLTFADAAGGTKAICTVTVTAPEPVRFAYSTENSPPAGRPMELVAVTDPSKTSVTFTIGNSSSTATEYTTETHTSFYGLPTNTVRVFRTNLTINAPGSYTVQTSAGGQAGKSFTVLVKAAGEGVNTTSTATRAASTELLRVLANFEGSVPEIEDDVIASGNPTVGYGYVVPQNGTFYNNLTTSELWGMLAEKVNTGGYAAAVNNFRSSNNLKMSQAQFDALVSFVYNCGSAVLNPRSYNTPKVMLNAVSFAAAPSESQPVTGTVNISDAVFRGGASSSSPALATIPEGTAVSIIGVESFPESRQVWYKIRYNNQTGYVAAGLVLPNTTGITHDLAYADAGVLATNFLEWHKSGSSHIYGLLTRRLAECKIFFFGNYADAYHSSPNYAKNTYGFLYPDCEKRYESN